MARNAPNLQLVFPVEESDAPASSFSVVALDELNDAQRKRVKTVCRRLVPGAGILGVARTPRRWDLRPIVMHPDDANSSILRFLGPEIALSLDISSRINELFESVTAASNLSSRLYDWGVYEGQIWTRREYVHATLADLLNGQEQIPLDDAVFLATNIAKELLKWHHRGLTHGHLTPDNIFVSSDGSASLLDPGGASAIVEASAKLGLEAFPEGYRKKSFAPEIIRAQKYAETADLFGLGLVLQNLFQRVSVRTERPGLPLHGAPIEIQNCIAELKGNDPLRRPPLEAIIELFERGEKAYRDRKKKQQREAATEKPKIREQEERRPRKSTEEIKSDSAAEKGESLPSEKQAVRPVRARAKPTMMPGRRAPLAHKPEPEAVSEVPQSGAEILESTVPPEESLPEPQVTAPVTTESPLRTAMARSESQRVTADSGTDAAAETANVANENRAEKNSRNRKIPPARPNVVDDSEPVFEPTKASPPNGLGNNFFEPGSESLSSLRQLRASSLPSIVIAGLVAMAAILAYQSMRSPAVPAQDSKVEGAAHKALSQDELKLAWSSRTPSMMAQVALAAIDAKHPNRYAQMLIVNSAMNDAMPVSGINVELLRIAFDSRWEAQLGETDRRAAFLLALSGIVQLTPDAERLPPLAKLHPAVVLAMSATGGENVKRALEDVPARVLGDLPPPFGPAFHELARNEPDISAGDDAVQILAKLGTTSIETEWVAQFLDEQAVSRLRALALLSSQDPKAARHILDIVLNNPNVRIEHPALRWARGWKLISWSSLSSSDQLLILSGIPSGTKLRTEDIAKLFSHPLPSMRVSAIDEALERIRMGHPGALAVLSELKNQPELLDPEQTVLLARLLENPENATVDEVRKWLSLSPPLELVAKLLVATSEEKSATTLDFEAMRFLKDRSWKPSVEDLRKLVLHPDPLTRLFAYSSVYQSVDRDTALTILSQSQKREENREFKEQLRTMIGALAQ